MNTDIDNYIAIGYFITRYVPFPPERCAGILPTNVCSLSSCLSSFVPDGWCLEWVKSEWDQRDTKAAEFGVAAADLHRLTDWAGDSFDKQFGYPRVIFSLEAARKIVSDFLPADDAERVVVGVGLHERYRDQFLEWDKPLPQQPGFAPIGTDGYYEMCDKKGRLTPSGVPMGFELINCDRMPGCSWLCNQLHVEFSKRFGTQSSEFGLLADEQEADRLAGLLNDGTIHAESGLWIPLLIVRYPEQGE